ncbi:serine hydrolase [Microbacterium deminutum]|uniref:Beta-lactamase-related domain-containing protein n=1 Tax=Microbacterium deminutum TaxID=344164 RepID=A0ABN2QIV4_9MICO
MDFVAYHDRTSADHQAHFDDLFPQGYRITSLSVYGRRGDERYAAVWVRRGGPDWSAVHGVDFAGYQAAFDNAVAAGFKPVLLTATGPADDPVFAGTFEQRSGSVPLTRHGLVRGDVSDAATIDHWLDQARRNRWLPTSIAVYGEAPDLRYAGIWVDDSNGTCWTLDGLGDTAGEYQARFDALVPVGAFPHQVAVSPDGRYTSIFRDDRVDDWFARHELSSAGYQQVFDQFVPQGYWPLSVQGGGAGASTRFAVVFGKSDARLPLTWRAPTGPVANAALDDIMQQAMARHRIRGAGIALVQAGRLVYARGYTLAEPHYPAVQPSTRFRQASVSKTIVALAVHRLIQDGQLTFGTRVQDVLALTQPDGSAVPSMFHDVTVQHLLEHTSGLPTNPYGIEPQVALAFDLAGRPTQLPVDGRKTDRFLVTQPASPPPTTPSYSNWGYFLLGHVVMKVTGKTTLPAALSGLLTRPLSITGLRIARTRVEGQTPGEARYHPTLFGIGASIVDQDRRWRATGYGGFWGLERNDGGGGLSASVVAVARLLAMLDIRTNNPVLQPATIANLFTMAMNGGGHGFDTALVIDAAAGSYYGMKGGSLPESSQNCVRYMTGDLSMVLCWNRHDIGEGAGGDGWWYPDFPLLLNAARSLAWAGDDLFPTFGMPSLA